MGGVANQRRVSVKERLWIYTNIRCYLDAPTNSINSINSIRTNKENFRLHPGTGVPGLKTLPCC